MSSLRRRSCGLLLHLTSLPGGHGVGDMGLQARRFIDGLKRAKQSWWQMLPIGPVGAGDSPYSSPSAMAGHPLLISLEDLVADGLLKEEDLAGAPDFPAGRADFDGARAFKEPRLRKAFAAFMSGGSAELWTAFRRFSTDHHDWLDDWAMYRALKEQYSPAPWTQWEPAIRDRRFREWSRELLHKLGEESTYHQFVQFLFARQWGRLREHAASAGVGLIGDVPIFVAHESADVWAHREIFHLDARGQPSVVAGVPPDYFSATGQHWGNPHYRWEILRQRGYDWWLARLRAASERFDAVRLDHFIGFSRYWEIPADAKTAVTGRWVPGPGADFLETVRAKLPELELIAEDLGCVSPEVAQLRDRFDLPGMRVLQFAFGNDQQAAGFLPRNYPRRAVAYTGTHDNDTTAGWYANTSEKERHEARVYLSSDGSRISWDMMRCLAQSAADVTIFPVQDVLGLGAEARMNKPGTTEGNWAWRLRAPLEERALEPLARLMQETKR